jgi:glycerate kinase
MKIDYNKQKGGEDMKVVAMIDSFKGCATSEELNQAVLAGLPDEIWTEKCTIPIADGGEGTMAAIYAELGGIWQSVTTQNPLGKPITGQYLLSRFEGQEIAVIESVEVSDAVIRQTSSYGLGKVIQDALAHRVTKIYLTLGGSATSDGGLGLLQSLGATIEGSEEGNLLINVNNVDLKGLQGKLDDVKLVALADVTNPYLGKKGFAEIFAPQKGASKNTVSEMEQQAKLVAKKIKQQTNLDLATISGSGAAGGLGGAVIVLGGKIAPGFVTLQKIIRLEEKLQQADLIFTGEGKMDGQTDQGKVPFGVAQLAKKAGIPVIGLCGSRSRDIGEMTEVTLGVFSIQQGPISLKEAMEKERTLTNIQQLASQLSQVFMYKKSSCLEV